MGGFFTSNGAGEALNIDLKTTVYKGLDSNLAKVTNKVTNKLKSTPLF